MVTRKPALVPDDFAALGPVFFLDVDFEPKLKGDLGDFFFFFFRFLAKVMLSP